MALLIPQQIFNKYIDKNSLKTMVNTKQIEGLYLEFKQKRDRSNGELHDDDKRNFSEGLSQFANSDGGVQIWGIENGKPNDYAKKLKPIQNIDIFQSTICDYLQDAVQPMIDGIVVESIYQNKKEKTGYLKILIPRSDKTPHRAVFTREYLKRNSIGKVRLEHYDLEDMFGRRQKPDLTLNFIRKKIDDNICFQIFMNNSGCAIGREVLIIIGGLQNKQVEINFNLPHIKIDRLDDMNDNKPTYQLNTHGNIFYPSVNTRLGDLNVNIKDEKKHSNIKELKINWMIYADNMLSKNGTETLII